jgi:hypothetical protein
VQRFRKRRLLEIKRRIACHHCENYHALTPFGQLGDLAPAA